MLWYRVVDLYSFRSYQGGTINSIQIYTCIYKVFFLSYVPNHNGRLISFKTCISSSVFLLDVLTILVSYPQLDTVVCSTNCPALVSYPQLDPVVCSTNCPALVSYPQLDPVLLNICVTDHHGYVPFITIPFSFSLSSLVTEFATRVTWWMQHVEQEMLAHPENLSSHPVFLGSYYSIFSFLSIGLHTIVCPFVLFLLSIVLSVLPFTASDYPFDIFKLFFLSSADYLYIRFNVGFYFLFFLNWFQFSFLFILFLPDCTSCISLHRGLFSAVVLLTVCFPLISNHCQCRSAIKEYMSSSPILSGVCVAQSLPFCVVFCRSFLSFSLLCTH